MLILVLPWFLFSRLSMAMRGYLSPPPAPLARGTQGATGLTGDDVEECSKMYGVLEMHGLFNIISDFGPFNPWENGLGSHSY